jgi:Glu-tRNA(Gln) amidotransferase subunit E-like FAD-binding protein
MNKTRTNKLYNFLVNTYGLSKELVLEHVTNRLDDLISKHINSKLDSNNVERIIANQVANVLENGFKNGSFNRNSLENLIRNRVVREIQDRLNNEYTIDVKLTKRDNTIIHRN